MPLAVFFLEALSNEHDSLLLQRWVDIAEIG
jgi:hypothetical protein